MNNRANFPYNAPKWLPGGNLQTIWAAKMARRTIGAPPQFVRQRWTAPDGDFVDVDWLRSTPDPAQKPGQTFAHKPKTLLVLFHGLEGSSSSHYAQAFAEFARTQGLGFAVPHFRGCSGELNLAPRAYHSGDHEEIDWLLTQCQTAWRALGGEDVVAVGVSLGGNALLRWAQERGETACQTVRAVAAVCSPIDLAASGAAIGRGFNRMVYTRMFLKTMKPRALEKLAQFPGLFDRHALLVARDLFEFDNVFTAPLHGFKNTHDYWARCSAQPHLQRLRLPSLVVNALNDPFVPWQSLPDKSAAHDYLTLWQPRQGGHVGFVGGAWPGQVMGMPQAVGQWLLAASLSG